MEKQTLIVAQILNAPTSRIWQALTDNNQLQDWYFKLDGFEPRIGFEFEFKGQGHKGEQYTHHCRITAVEPEKKLTYTWAYEGIEGTSEVTFELFAEDEGTQVRITHTGLETFPQGNPDFASSSFNQGWNYILGTSLKGYLEK